MVHKEGLLRLLERAELEVTDWQLDLLVKILNSDKPLRLEYHRE